MMVPTPQIAAPVTAERTDTPNGAEVPATPRQQAGNEKHRQQSRSSGGQSEVQHGIPSQAGKSLLVLVLMLVFGLPTI